MVIRHRAMALMVAAVVGSAAVAAQQQQQQQQQQPPPQQQTPAPTEAQKREIEAIVQAFDAVAKGEPAPNDLSVTWLREDILKAQGNRQYVPFTVTLDRSAVSGNTVTVYWRAVAKETAPAAPAAGGAAPADADAAAPLPPQFAFEDMNTATLPASGPIRISRAMSVPAGTFDIFVLVKEPTSTESDAAPAKVSLIQHTLEIPDFWVEELNTSSVIIAEEIQPLAAPLTPQQQSERPYAMGSMEIIPAVDMAFTTQDEIGMFLLIYNARTDSANKPDVTVEFNFYVTADGAEKFYNKTAPQDLNAQTLPPQFDVAAGHQLQAGQVIPLASFPAGEYRLEVKVTDKLANASVTRNVNFTVTG